MLGVSGASTVSKEKDLVLAISKILAKKLSQVFKAKVVLTRKSDTYVPLPKRTAVANDAHADLFLSIHANSSPKNQIKGIEVYFLSDMPSDAEAGETAEAENKAGATGETEYLTDLDKTLLDLVQTSHVEGSRLFAEKVVSSLELDVREKLRGIKHANFWVLSWATMPAVLVEVGYLSNKEEAKDLHLASTQEAICTGLVKGIKDFQEAWRRSGGRPEEGQK
jgi:N-acetylmuramoyl-L-alanine amidase